MKQISELTEQEILALTDEQMELMVKVRMAEEGIKILERPEQPDYITIAPKDDMAYTVKGFSLVIRDKAIAEKLADYILDTLKDTVAPSYRKDYNLKYLKEYSSDDYNFKGIGEVVKEEYYTSETLNKIEESVKTNKDKKDKYEALLSEYNQAYDSASYIREEIYQKFSDITGKYYEMDRMVYRYEEYLVLANGDSDIAMAFLKKAYNINEEIEAYILPNQPKCSQELAE